ncbi:MAG TPA: ISL3 family transposase [Pseudonocardiaceae bacterium]|nr:ISL3 family transposase [Pseudonocardiaceae bacterium]
MRATTAFNRMLGIVGATVAGVVFTPAGIVVDLRLRRRRLVCPCGWTTWACHGRSTRRWRHLDLGGSRLWLRAEVRRLACRRCRRARTEQMPWARPGARHTRDFQDVVAWLAQRTDKTTITRLLRISWEAVARIVATVVADQIDDARLDELYRIGVDEVSYRKGHRYLTVVADHDRDGALVWAGEGKDHTVLERFYDELGEQRLARLQAVSLDMGGAYKKATDAKAPHVRQCVDPFHVVKLANDAVDKARRQAWNAHRDLGMRSSVWVKRTRWALLKDPDRLKESQVAVLHELRRNRSVLYRCWQLKEGLRDLYRLARPADAPAHLDWWLAWACRCRVPAFVALSRTVRANRERILAAVELGLSNSKLEGLASKIRLINHRGYGHHSAAALIAMIYLCAGGITVELPLR